MSIEINNKPRMVRFETGTPKQIEDLVATYGNEYMITHYHFWNAGDEARMTIVMVHASVIRQMQIAQASLPGGRGH